MPLGLATRSRSGRGHSQHPMNRGCDQHPPPPSSPFMSEKRRVSDQRICRIGGFIRFISRRCFSSLASSAEILFFFPTFPIVFPFSFYDIFTIFQDDLLLLLLLLLHRHQKSFIYSPISDVHRFLLLLQEAKSLFLLFLLLYCLVLSLLSHHHHRLFFSFFLFFLRGKLV